jgi:predicted RNase H-like HicB family nuclease
MLTYKAMYKFCDDGIHAEVLDFPGAISSGADLKEARTMIQSALLDMADFYLETGKPLPLPNSQATDPEADLEEPLYLLLKAASHVEIVPREVSA